MRKNDKSCDNHHDALCESRRSGRLLLISVGVVLLASFLAAVVQTSGGQVAVRAITFPTQNGQWLAADLFKPANATRNHKAPLVVVVPGFQRSKEALSNISIELSRRGVVVIAIDPYAQGNSSASMSAQAATKEGYGMYAVVDYAFRTSALNYIDKSRIGATGHSAGGNAVLLGASHFGKKARQSGRPNPLSAIYVSGYAMCMTEGLLKPVNSNVGMSYALFDEGAFRNELKHGNMRKAPEALRLVNSGIPNDPVAELEVGKYYGSVSDKTLRVVHNERLLHPLQPYSVAATANQLEYFEKVFNLDSSLSSHDQIWYWKELFTLVSSIAALVAIVPFSRLMLQSPFFRTLVHPTPPAPPKPQGKGNAIFWGVFALSAIIACFSYIPLSELSQRLFVTATNRGQTWFFPQRMNNAVMLWAVVNGTVGLLIFGITYWLYGSKNGARSEMWGLQTTPGELLKTLLLAGITCAFFVLLLFVVYYFMHVDYRFVFFGARVFQPVMILLLCMYAPFFLVFFLSNSLRVNGAMRFAGQPEWKSMLIAGFANSAGLILIVFIQYVVLAVTRTVYWTDGWLYVNLLFAIVPMMFVLPYFNRYFFRMTGRVYLGAFTTCLVFILILVSNTVCYTPL